MSLCSLTPASCCTGERRIKKTSVGFSSRYNDGEGEGEEEGEGEGEGEGRMIDDAAADASHLFPQLRFALKGKKEQIFGS